MSQTHSEDEPTVEQQLELAVKELEQGELRSALGHLAIALSIEPTYEPALEVLEQALAAAGPQALELLTFEKETFFGLAALRAYALAHAGYPEEALEILFEVACFRPSIPYLLWAPEWFSSPLTPGRFAGVAADELAAQAVSFVEVVDALDEIDADSERNLQAAQEVLAALLLRHPASERLHFAQQLALRRLGRVEEAIELASQWFEQKPSWVGAISLANAYRQKDDVPSAVAYYRKALQQSPAELTPLLDIGDVLLEDGRFAEAAAAYQQVLDNEEHRSWAEPSYVFCQWMHTERKQWRQQLQKLASEAQKESRAGQLWQHLRLLREELAEPGEVTARAVRDVVERLAQDRERARAAGQGTVRLEVTQPESPSIRLAFALSMQQLGLRFRLQIQADEPTQGERQSPRGPAHWGLWTFSDGEPQAALQPPPKNVAAMIGRVAEQPYELEAWYGHAQWIARKLGPEAAEQVLATMVHPPLPEQGGIPSVLWVQRVQVAAALVLTGLDLGWKDSVRRNALFSLLRGPADWTVGAGCIAAAALAEKEPETRDDIEAEFSSQLEQVPDTGYCPYEYPLVLSWLLLGGLSQEQKRKLWQRKRRLERSSSASD